MIRIVPNCLNYLNVRHWCLCSHSSARARSKLKPGAHAIAVPVGRPPKSRELLPKHMYARSASNGASWRAPQSGPSVSPAGCACETRETRGVCVACRPPRRRRRYGDEPSVEVLDVPLVGITSSRHYLAE